MKKSFFSAFFFFFLSTFQTLNNKNQVLPCDQFKLHRKVVAFGLIIEVSQQITLLPFIQTSYQGLQDLWPWYLPPILQILSRFNPKSQNLQLSFSYQLNPKMKLDRNNYSFMKKILTTSIKLKQRKFNQTQNLIFE